MTTENQITLRDSFISAPLEALLDTKTVSAYTGLSISYFHCKAVHGGGIPYRKIGHKRLYQKQDVLAWLDENTKKVTSTSQYERSTSDGPTI